MASLSHFIARCDCPDEKGHLVGCQNPVEYGCSCNRCFREPPDGRFYACAEHRGEVQARHQRVYERPAVLVRYGSNQEGGKTQ